MAKRAMRKGDVVRYNCPADDMEHKFLFVIVDGPFDGRVHIQCLNSGLNLPGIEVVAADEVVLVPKEA